MMLNNFHPESNEDSMNSWFLKENISSNDKDFLIFCVFTSFFNFLVVVAAAVLVVVLVEEAVADFLVAAAEVILGAALRFRVEFQGLEGADNMPNNAPRILAGARICY